MGDVNNAAGQQYSRQGPWNAPQQGGDIKQGGGAPPQQSPDIQGLMQALQQAQQPQMSPNQMAAAQYSHGGVSMSPWNSPYSGYRDSNFNKSAMGGLAGSMVQDLRAPDGSSYGFSGGNLIPDGHGGWSNPSLAAQMTRAYGPPQQMPTAPSMMPQRPGMQQNPSIGLSGIVQQMQGGLSPIAARQQLSSLAGVPRQGPGIGSAQPQFQAPATSTWSSQGPAPAPQPFSPLAHEGYLQRR